MLNRRVPAPIPNGPRGPLLRIPTSLPCSTPDTPCLRIFVRIVIDFKGACLSVARSFADRGCAVGVQYSERASQHAITVEIQMQPEWAPDFTIWRAAVAGHGRYPS